MDFIPFLLLNLLYFVLGFAGLFLIIYFVVPFSAFVLGKCISYLSLWFVSVRQHGEFKICRAPFASLRGVIEQPDITIKTADKTLQIHFIDVPRNFRRILTLINSREYYVTNTESGRMTSGGGSKDFIYAMRGRAVVAPYFGGLRLTKDKIRPIPEFPPVPSEYHVLLITPGYIKARLASGYDKVDANGELWVGDHLLACSAKMLKKRLQGDLRTPFGPSRQK